MAGKSKWTQEMIEQDARKYSSRYEWQKSSKGYAIAFYRGIVDICCAHMESKHMDWTHERIFSEAIKYNSKKEWEQKSYNSYQAAARNSSIDLYCVHMTKLNKNWSNDELFRDALLYNFRSDWYKANPKAYRTAYRRNLLEVCCSHMSYKPSFITDDIGVIYAFIFSDNTAYIGLTIDPARRFKDHLKHGPVFTKISNSFSYDYKILEQDIPNKILSEREIFFINEYKRNGISLLNTHKGGARGTISRRKQSI